MKKLKIVLIGAGSIAFGRGTIATLMADREFDEFDTTLYLVDTNPSSLDLMTKLAHKIKSHYNSRIKIESAGDRKLALKNADYVISSIAQKRMQLWEQDFRVPLAFGFKHINGENGGPGAAFHTLRSLDLTIPMCRDMEKLCPDALLLNFTNPESRVCLGVSKLTKIKCVGLCHGFVTTWNFCAYLLGRKREELDMTVAGINHFHWLIKLWDKKTKKDLMGSFNGKLKKFKKLMPLTRQMYDIFGLLPFPIDNHIGEYVSYAHELTGLRWGYGNEGKIIHKKEYKSGEEKPARERNHNDWVDIIRNSIIKAVNSDSQLPTEVKLPQEVTMPTEELAIPIILDIEKNKRKRELAVNVPNEGRAITNLPEDAIVEVPALVDRNGIHPEKVGPLPDGIASICKVQIDLQNMLVKAFAEKSKKYLLQALLLDPVVDSVSRAKEMMELMLKVEKDFLPELK